jgi:O-antigen ligase
VAPTATWPSLVSLLPPLAVFFATLLMDARQRRVMTAWLLAFGAVSVFLGLSQVAQGQTSPLRFFVNTNPTEAVGFFANRNHFAALLYVMILLAAAWASGSATQILTTPAERRFEAAIILPIMASFMLLVVFVAGEILSRSRAGLGLTIVALLGAFVLGYSDRRARSGLTMARLLLGMIVLTTLLVVQFGLYRVLERFANDPLADGRLPFARNTIEAAQAFFPFGSGIGTFTMVYPTFEKTNDLMPNTFANHAHNDILELWMEAGVPGAVVAVLCALWILYRMLRVWRAGSWGTRAVDLLLARAASLAIGLVAVHSLFDYPLRTGAMMTLVAFCCALLTPPAGHTHLDDAIESDAARREPGLRSTPAMVEPGPARSPTLGGERWGKGIVWPDAWRRPGNAPLASPRGRGSDDDARNE